MMRPPTPGSHRTSDDAPAVAPEVDRPAHPPEVHLLGERVERGVGIDGDLDFG